MKIVLYYVLYYSFHLYIEHVLAYRTSIAQRMLLCTLFFSQQISAPELLPHKGLNHLHSEVVHCRVANYCVRRRNAPK